MPHFTPLMYSQSGTSEPLGCSACLSPAGSSQSSVGALAERGCCRLSARLWDFQTRPLSNPKPIRN